MPDKKQNTDEDLRSNDDQGSDDSLSPTLETQYESFGCSKASSEVMRRRDRLFREERQQMKAFFAAPEKTLEKRRALKSLESTFRAIIDVKRDIEKHEEELKAMRYADREIDGILLWYRHHKLTMPAFLKAEERVQQITLMAG